MTISTVGDDDENDNRFNADNNTLSDLENVKEE